MRVRIWLGAGRPCGYLGHPSADDAIALIGTIRDAIRVGLIPQDAEPRWLVSGDPAMVEEVRAWMQGRGERAA